MKNIRIITQLNIKGSNVVKPVHTEALRIVGDPKSLAKKYYESGADEIIYLDIVASLYQRNFDFDLLKSVAQEIFIPITVGGGIKTLHDIANALRVGADKVAINTHACKNPEFLRDAAHEFGSQCIVLFVEAKKVGHGKWEPYTDGGRERTGLDTIDWIKQAAGLGVGEVLITSIDRDGTKQGYDLDLVRAVTAFTPTPVIAHGGAGDLNTIKEVILDGKADAVSAASVFHYDEVTIPTLKAYLTQENINVRLK